MGHYGPTTPTIALEHIQKTKLSLFTENGVFGSEWAKKGTAERAKISGSQRAQSRVAIL